MNHYTGSSSSYHHPRDSYVNVKSSGYGSKSYSPTTGYSSTAARVHGTGQAGTSYTSGSIRTGIQKNTVSNRTYEYEVRSRPSSGSRPLPQGPGPLNSHNKKISVPEATSKLRPSSRRHETTSNYRTPVKADHDLSSITSISSQSSAASYAPSTSHTNHYGSTHGRNSNLHRRRDYASTSSLNSDSTQSIKENLHHLNISDSKKSSSSYVSTDGSELPNIHTSSRYGASPNSSDKSDGRSRRDNSLSSDSDGGDRPRRSSSANRSHRHSPNFMLNSDSNVRMRHAVVASICTYDSMLSFSSDTSFGTFNIILDIDMSYLLCFAS